MYLIHRNTSQTCLRFLKLCSLCLISFQKAEFTNGSGSACSCIPAQFPTMRTQFHSQLLENSITQHHITFPRFLFTSTQSTAVMGSRAGKAERLFNKITMLNLCVTLKDPSGALTQLSPDHSMTVYTQPRDRTALKHPQKPFASTEVGI